MFDEGLERGIDPGAQVRTVDPMVGHPVRVVTVLGPRKTSTFPLTTAVDGSTQEIAPKTLVDHVSHGQVKGA